MNQNQFGFFDLANFQWEKPCMDPEHNMPTHIYVPPGKGYRHICPNCKAESVIFDNHVTMKAEA